MCIRDRRRGLPVPHCPDLLHHSLLYLPPAYPLSPFRVYEVTGPKRGIKEGPCRSYGRKPPVYKPGVSFTERIAHNHPFKGNGGVQVFFPNLPSISLSLPV